MPPKASKEGGRQQQAGQQAALKQGPHSPHPPPFPPPAAAGSASAADFVLRLQRCLAFSGGTVNISGLAAAWLAAHGEPLIPQQYGAQSTHALLQMVRRQGHPPLIEAVYGNEDRNRCRRKW